MPKSRSRSRRNRKGGFEMNDLNPFGSSTGSSSATGSSSGSSWYNNLNPFAKKSDSSTSYTPPATSYTAPPATSYTAPDTSYTAPDTSYTAPPATSMGYGGKRRRRRMRGGSVTPNMSLTNLASSAAPISGIDTVKAQTWVGGKSKRRRHGKSCKKSCRKH